MLEGGARGHRFSDLEVFFQKAISRGKMADKIALGHSRSRKIRGKFCLRVRPSVLGEKEVTSRHLAFVAAKPSCSIVE